LTGFELKEVLMMPVSYAEVCRAFELRNGVCGVAEEDPPPYEKDISQSKEDDAEGLFGTEEELYSEILESLADRYLKDRYSLCLEIRHKDQVVYTFPKIACPRLIVEQLKLATRKL
jgi:hypothetical protein